MSKSIFKTLIVIALIIPKVSLADEGMWLPMFINKLNYAEMQGKGLKLTPEEIYNVNNSSLKDAIVRLGRGFCSGEMISKEGLFLTNHHCGYNVIQENSTTEHDYLTNGFWAMSKEEELPAGFSVSYLVHMVDVSTKINSELNESMSEEERANKVNELKQAIIEENIKNDENGYEYEIKGFFKGNEFYMLVYNTFNDVRLVGAPPSSIGKFGGDTDNWMWPRQTGDFTLFRVYADIDNKPANFSKENIPYKPKHHLPISMKGVEKGDYAMIFGYPGSTDRYLTSYGVKLAIDQDQPARVKIRRKKLDLYEEGQAKSDKIRIQYAAKHAQVSNYWKYFIGQTRGLKRLNVYEKKKQQEIEFMEWVSKDDGRKQKYKDVMNMYEKAYSIFNNVELASTYWTEAIYGTEIIAFGFPYLGLEKALLAVENSKKEDEATQQKVKEALEKQIERLKEGAKNHFKDYNADIDLKVMAAMFELYDMNLPENQKPKQFNDLVKKYKKDYNKIAETVFSKSFFTSEDKVISFLENPSAKVLDKDMSFQIAKDFLIFYYTVIPAFSSEAEDLKEKADRLYVAGLREMNTNKSYYPDANSTMRFTYGNILDYSPQDAVHYNYFTTLKGVIEKEDPNNSDYTVPQKLKDLYYAKDYGQYAAKNGEIYTCFISNNDITGGNSGSGVINANGELIGTAFDGNWEAMSGDIAFESDLQRTISVDIRYTLFIIDKFAGAKHLIDEMDLVFEKIEATEVTESKK